MLVQHERAPAGHPRLHADADVETEEEQGMTGRVQPGRRATAALRRTCAGALVSLLVLTGCGSGGNGVADAGRPASPRPSAGASAAGPSGGAPAADPDGSASAGDPDGSASAAGPAGRASVAHTSRQGQERSCPREALAGMNLPQRVGQVFVTGVRGTGPTHRELRLVRRRHLGGAILMGHDTVGVDATRRIAHRLQRHATSDGVGLWVAADQEGGQVQRLQGSGFSTIPDALTQGRMRRPALRRKAHRWGTQLHEAGVNLNLAPVLDTVPAALGSANAPIGQYDREYGHTPRRVTRHGLAFLEGMRAAEVTPTVKHFPGLGRVRRNTDTSRNVVDDTTTRTDPYLRPFRAAVRDGVSVVMVSSARYTRIDRRHLAPFSPTVLRGMLRGDLGFDGVVMSDDLAIAKAVSGVPVGLRAVRFLRAGGSVVLAVDAAAVRPMVRAVLRRAREHPTFRSRVDAEALRVLRAKHAAGLLPCS